MTDKTDDMVVVAMRIKRPGRGGRFSQPRGGYNPVAVFGLVLPAATNANIRNLMKRSREAGILYPKTRLKLFWNITAIVSNSYPFYSLEKIVVAGLASVGVQALHSCERT